MAYEQGMLEMALAAAVGNDPALVLELRTAFLDSAEANFGQLVAVTNKLDWELGALRLKGLAASFGAEDLLRAAERLGGAPFGDKDALAAVRAELNAIAA
ncbi:HPt (histidine-containing phosphotransfer) domain-containing protein [Sphingomonas jejuensis]|uniref:HPt (Histidine-containing phosphotransfer) domain-containing protein n=1 Tax=Sphingomonas jejuensis TaxID=904715 RepID=A0ABX0XIZ9_9SPHN|nr:Hpt domain-containing protein [Sphingomonas jejuensis]NJC33199.1 HPt (histidine-containing phosphotransfer) domain-containing protein [Sphingomonas jejuensis]